MIANVLNNQSRTADKG